MKLPFSRRAFYASDDLHGVYEYNVPGTYTFKLSRRTRVKIIFIQSGDGPNNYGSWSPGSGGGGFIGQAYLAPGQYSVFLGQPVRNVMSGYGSTFITNYAQPSTLSNSNGELLSVTSAAPAYSQNFEPIAGTVEMEEGSNGYDIFGTTGAPAKWNGYGKGSDARSTSNHTTGYFKIEW